MQASPRRAAGHAGQGLRSKVYGGADQRQYRSGYEDRELILAVALLLGSSMGRLGQVPAIRALDERQLLEGTGGIVPGEGEVDRCSVMNSADFHQRFPGAAEICSMLGQDLGGGSISPGGIRYIAVQPRHS